MYFKNAQLYAVSMSQGLTAALLDEQLRRRVFQHCGSQDMSFSGFVSPAGNDQLVHAIGDDWLICLQTEQRILPSAVIQQEADERAAELAEQQGFKLGRKQMKDLREQVAQELMPRAFVRRSRTYAWIDTATGRLAVDAPSASRAEDLIELLRHCTDDLSVTLLRTDKTPTAAMADWLASNAAPEGFTIDQDCELRSVTEDRAAVRYTHHPLEGDEIKGHLEAAKLPTRLALTFDDRVSFVLTEKLEIKRIDFLDVIREQAGAAEDESELFDIEFVLMASELRLAVGAMIDALGGLLVPVEGPLS